MSVRTLEEILKEQNKLSAPQLAAEKDAYNKVFDTQVQNTQNTYDTEIKKTEQSYNELYDQNAVQKIINERQIAENMANLGLTDLGLNRTQQTAAQLSYANNAAKIGQQKQTAVDTLAQAMTASKSEIEANRASTLAGLESQYMANDRSIAANIRNSELEAENERIKNELQAENERIKAETERIAALQKAADQQYADQQKVLEALGNKNLNADGRAQWINWYGNKYGVDASTLYSLFGSANTKYTVSDDDDLTDTAGISLSDDEITQILSKYHESNESTATLYDLIEKYNIDPNSAQGIAIRNKIETMTEGTRLFWTNPHVDGPLTYTAGNESDKVFKDGIAYASTINVEEYGNVWTLRDVFNASTRALAKEKYKDDWEKHVSDEDIVKEAKVQTKKVQTKVFG